MNPGIIGLFLHPAVKQSAQRLRAVQDTGPGQTGDLSQIVFDSCKKIVFLREVTMSRLVRFFCCVSLLAFCTTSLLAQGIFATLTGVVTDPSESVVPNGKVTLRDVGSGSVRETVSNAEG